VNVMSQMTLKSNSNNSVFIEIVIFFDKGEVSFYRKLEIVILTRKSSSTIFSVRPESSRFTTVHE
jgi:hypothetical protein